MTATPNKSLNRSGGSASLINFGPAQVARIAAARLTQPFDSFA